jgi:hypothetical protein
MEERLVSYRSYVLIYINLHFANNNAVVYTSYLIHETVQYRGMLCTGTQMFYKRMPVNR